MEGNATVSDIKITVSTCLNPLSKDSDGDGVPDGEDLHPFYDALLKLHIRQREENVVDWGLVDDLHRFSLSKITVDDTWDSGLSQRFEGRLRGEGITLFRNIDDTTDSVDIVIEDFWMNPPNLVLPGNSQFTFNVEDGTWSGETWAEYVQGSMGEYTPLYIYEDPAYTAIIEVSFSIAPEINPGRQRMLAEMYSPVLYFHEDEEYFPVDIGSFLSQSTLVKNGPNTQRPTPDDLAEHPSSSNYLSLWNNFENMHNPTVYSRVFTATDNKIVIQYWFFYLYNDHTFDHEGDWEMMQIICDENGNPDKVGYSQHYGGDKRSWNSDDVEKVDGTHPKVYVAKGGHASYFESGETDLAFGFGGTDHHEGNGRVLNSSNYSTRKITSENWLNFQGDWGGDSGSVAGPVFRHTKILKPKAYMWIEPMYWYSIL